jgi:hypothetical protein
MANEISTGMYRKLFDLLDQKKVTGEGLQSLLTSGILADVCDAGADLSNREAVRVALKLGTVLPETFRLIVNYGQSLDTMIANGHYDWKNDSITSKRFPPKGEGVVEFEARIFHFDRSIESKDAITAIEAADTENLWHAGLIEHLLTFGAKFPEEQRKYPIIALGSVAEIGGRRSVPELWEDRAERRLSLVWFDDRWRESCRFLAVRKVSAA